MSAIISLCIIIIIALVLYSQGLKISKCKNLCSEWLRWGLRNCELFGTYIAFETLNCHENALVQERGLAVQSVALLPIAANM